MIIKSSGQTKEYKSGYFRDSEEGKPRFDLIVPENVPYNETLLYRVASLYSRGAKGRGDRAWEKANTLEELDRAKASCFRHFMQAMCGEQDEDHWAAVVFNINFIILLEGKLNETRK